MTRHHSQNVQVSFDSVPLQRMRNTFMLCGDLLFGEYRVDARTLEAKVASLWWHARTLGEKQFSVRHEGGRQPPLFNKVERDFQIWCRVIQFWLCSTVYWRWPRAINLEGILKPLQYLSYLNKCEKRDDYYFDYRFGSFNSGQAV